MSSGSGHIPIDNPYIVGNPIKGSRMFFGREDDFAYIRTKFSVGVEGGLIVLCGTRRSGKTSILFQIADGRLGDDFVPAIIDMQSMAISSEDDFVARAIELISASARDRGVTPPSAPGGANACARFEAYVLALMEKMGGKKLVLAFDEYELIETNLDAGLLTPQILRTLANLIEQHQMYVVFTGSDELAKRNSKHWGLFLSKAIHRRISFLSPADTLRLITEPVAEVVQYEDDVPGRVAELTAGQPFYTQVVCQNLIDRLNDERRYDADVEDVEEVVREVVDNPLPQMIFNWNALSQIERFCLSVTGELSRTERVWVSVDDVARFAESEKTGYRVDPGAAAKAMENLFHGDLLEKDDAGGTYRFKMDLWRRWIGRMHSIWKAIAEIEQEGGAQAGGGLVRVSGSGWKRMAWIGGAVAAAAAAAISAWILFGPEPPEPVTAASDATGALVRPGEALATLTVASTPTAADIYIDGQLVGRTPTERSFAAGDRELVIEIEGYRPHRETLTLGAGESTGVNVQLAELTGSIRITSDPPGAAITLDGAATGQTTPATFEGLSVNRSVPVSLSLAGYPDVGFQVRAEADSTVEVTRSMGTRRTELTVASNPPGAFVFLDERPVGRAPHRIDDVTYGTHTLRVVQDGYAEWTREIQVPVAGGRLDAVLERLAPGVVMFSIQPYGDVIIDGRRVAQGVTFFPITREAGAYQIELRNPAFEAFKQEITVVSGDTLRIRHDFAR